MNSLELKITDLSEESLIHVFSKLNEKELCVAALVCRYFNTMAGDKAVWNPIKVERGIQSGLNQDSSAKTEVIQHAKKTIHIFGSLYQKINYNNMFEKSLHDFLEKNETNTESQNFIIDRSFIFCANI